MTPTLAGRLQTRLVLLIVLGFFGTILIGPFVAVVAGASYGDAVRLGLRAVVIAALMGVLWEFAYHAFQQVRWEKDWPTLFGLLTGISEGIVVFVLLDAGVAGDVGPIPVDAFVFHFAFIWLLVWGVANGPLSIVVPRWRYNGGRFW